MTESSNVARNVPAKIEGSMDDPIDDVDEALLDDAFGDFKQVKESKNTKDTSLVSDKSTVDKKKSVSVSDFWFCTCCGVV